MMNSFRVVASSAIKCPLNKILDLFDHQIGFIRIHYIKMNAFTVVMVNLPMVKIRTLFLNKACMTEKCFWGNLLL